MYLWMVKSSYFIIILKWHPNCWEIYTCVYININWPFYSFMLSIFQQYSLKSCFKAPEHCFRFLIHPHIKHIKLFIMKYLWVDTCIVIKLYKHLFCQISNKWKNDEIPFRPYYCINRQRHKCRQKWETAPKQRSELNHHFLGRSRIWLVVANCKLLRPHSLKFN